MATASTREVTVIFTGDVSANIDFVGVNPSSPGGSDLVTLSAGNNPITVPTGGSAVTGVTIVPPSGNATAMTLKGVNGDTGIALNLTDPTSLGLAASATAFVINAAAGITGVRFIWS
jgi:hypothetical protein